MKTLLAAAAVWICAAVAWADCACFCVDGQARTLCSSIAEAQANPTFCGAEQMAGCPLDDAKDDGDAILQAPGEGAVHCRVERVWTAAATGYTHVKVCDVLNTQ